MASPAQGSSAYAICAVARSKLTDNVKQQPAEPQSMAGPILQSSLAWHGCISAGLPRWHPVLGQSFKARVIQRALNECHTAYVFLPRDAFASWLPAVIP